MLGLPPPPREEGQESSPHNPVTLHHLFLFSPDVVRRMEKEPSAAASDTMDEALSENTIPQYHK